VPVEVIRDGEPKKLEVTLREIPGEKAKASEPEESTKNDTLNGVAVADLDSATRSQLQIPAEVHGVLVKDVAQESPAYEKGLRPGDVIIEINHKAVRSADQAVEMTTNVKDPRTLLKIWQRNPESGRGGIRYMVVDESKGN
jgi:serine protease Do